MKIVFEVAGDRQIEREILRVGERAVDARPAWYLVADLFMRETARQFETEGAYASGGWAPLKQATLHRKELRGEDPRILHATGALRASLTLRGDPFMVLDAQPGELVFGSKLPYAAAHQSPRPGSRLPRRRPLEFTEQARRDTVKIIQRWIITGEAQRL